MIVIGINVVVVTVLIGVICEYVCKYLWMYGKEIKDRYNEYLVKQ